jgi:hypothetical protein
MHLWDLASGFFNKKVGVAREWRLAVQEGGEQDIGRCIGEENPPKNEAVGWLVINKKREHRSKWVGSSACMTYLNDTPWEGKKERIPIYLIIFWQVAGTGNSARLTLEQGVLT